VNKLSLPKPKPDEKKDDFLSRCIGDETMNKEYPDNKQRAAVCYRQWQNKREAGTDYETRSFEVRLAGTVEEPALTGYAAVFNENSQGLPFTERILPGAFKNSLANNSDILALVDHDPSKVIGRVSNQTLRLQENEHGLVVDIRPNMDTSFGRDIVASVQRGDIKNMSIGFICRKDDWKHNTRQLIDIDLKEISVVGMPAYSGTTIQKRKQEENEVNEKEREIRQQLADKTLLETELTTSKLETKAIPLILSQPAVDEKRQAFVNYLRGRSYDTRALVEGSDVAGGYLVPDQFLAELVRALVEKSVMRTLARTITISAETLKIPKLGSGVTANWTPEATAIAESQPVFGQLQFTPKKLAGLTLVSSELLADAAVNVETLLAELFGEKLGEVEDKAFFNGAGAMQPSGLLNDPTVSRVTTAANNAISADELIKQYDAVPAVYRPTSTWVMNSATLAYLRTLKDGVGNYLLITAGLTGVVPLMLLGRPGVLSDNLWPWDATTPANNAGKDVIIFGDFARAYYIVDRKGLEVQRSVDRYFEQDLVAFRAIKRVDGQVVLPAAAVVLRMHA
jgi:HK97 family phage major capsid protein/HK97 family phage prohead protease